jgi:hypothetical protein
MAFPAGNAASVLDRANAGFVGGGKAVRRYGGKTVRREVVSFDLPAYPLTRLPAYPLTRLPAYRLPAYPLTRLPAYPLTRLPAYPLTRLPAFFTSTARTVWSAAGPPGEP